jgi:hypothetical protein
MSTQIISDSGERQMLTCKTGYYVELRKTVVENGDKRLGTMVTDKLSKDVSSVVPVSANARLIPDSSNSITSCVPTPTLSVKPHISFLVDMVPANGARLQSIVLEVPKLALPVKPNIDIQLGMSTQIISDSGERQILAGKTGYYIELKKTVVENGDEQLGTMVNDKLSKDVSSLVPVSANTRLIPDSYNSIILCVPTPTLPVKPHISCLVDTVPAT